MAKLRHPTRHQQTSVGSMNRNHQGLGNVFYQREKRFFRKRVLVFGFWFLTSKTRFEALLKNGARLLHSPSPPFSLSSIPPFLHSSVPPLLFSIFILLLSACQTEPEQSLTEQRRQQLRPATVQVLQQAQRAQAQGRMAYALALADSAAVLAPELSDVHLLRGQLLTALRQYDAATDAFTEALVHDPAYDIAAFHLGNLAYQRERYDDALGYYYQTLGIEDIAEVDARDLPDRLAEEARLATLIQMGRTFRRLGESENAYATYRLALGLDSTHAATLGDLSVLYRDDGEIDQAIAHIRAALRTDSSNIDYQFILGSSLVLAGRNEDAIPPLQQVLENRPWQPGVHYNLGQALLRLGRIEEGQRYLVLADSVQPRNAEVRRLEIIAERRPDLPERWMQLGDAYRNASRYDDAIRAYQFVLRVRPDDAEIWFRLAQSYVHTGNVSGARRALARVTALQPDHEGAAVLAETL